MSLIDISENQLAFGYLHSFINVNKPANFMIPSIREEGGIVKSRFPGADIVINNCHLIQFKRPFYFVTNGIKEFRYFIKPHDISPPYFRFHIKNNNPTNQLNNLIRATQSGMTAEYISPLFTDDKSFFTLLKNDKLHLNSYAHIDIAQFKRMQKLIGNNNDHTIIYTQNSVNHGFCYCFSEPERILASNNRSSYQEREFTPYALIDNISSIFFPQDETKRRSENVMLQLQLLQQDLFIHHDIILQFNYIALK